VIVEKECKKNFGKLLSLNIFRAKIIMAAILDFTLKQHQKGLKTLKKVFQTFLQCFKAFELLLSDIRL
jgi:hypothetical protein